MKRYDQLCTIKNIQPSRYFKTSGHVLSDVKFGHADKVKILDSIAFGSDQNLEATSEGMAESKPSYTAKKLQSVLVHLEKSKMLRALVPQVSKLPASNASWLSQLVNSILIAK